jgi:hypothetical protein
MLHSLRDIKKTNSKKDGGVGETLLRQNFSNSERLTREAHHLLPPKSQHPLGSSYSISIGFIPEGIIITADGSQDRLPELSESISSSLPPIAAHRVDSDDWETPLTSTVAHHLHSENKVLQDFLFVSIALHSFL